MTTYEAVIAGLQMDTIKAILSKEGVDVSLISKTGEVKKSNFYKYTDIKKVNLSPIDVNRHQLTIVFENGENIKLVSRSLGKKNDNGKMRRDNIDQMESFNIWLKEFHEKIIAAYPVNNIEFSSGSTGKVILLGALLVFAVLAIFLAISIGKYGPAATLLGGVILIAALLFKLSSKKAYEPNNLPDVYRV
jgi:hypothetical protein